MGLSLNTNLMARNAARNLTCHYARLSSSTKALSSGLRVNSAADDAAGLAIRELMRADIDTLGQGRRNANDAISLIQTADGALAIIDEKLIRMKELAEQAATGTYDSIQRLIIESEYQQMALEIDRIANSTAFNGVKLLDGSLSGAHDGSTLSSSGALKVHFGTANDSAEDYYYITIGNCTVEALGLRKEQAVNPDGTKQADTYAETDVTFHPKDSYIEYTDPDTGDKYYTDGNFYFSDTSNPAGTRLDWETDGNLIKKLKPIQKTTTSYKDYDVYLDPDTGTEYYRDNRNQYTLDPYDPENALNTYDPNDIKIINRLQNTNKAILFEFIWKIYSDPNGNLYYSYNDGRTFVPNHLKPDDGIIDSTNSANKGLIATLKPEMTEKTVVNYFYRTFYQYYDVQTAINYWSDDGGKTFVASIYAPETSKLDPVADKDIIARLQPYPNETTVTEKFPKWIDTATGKTYYTLDYGKTFFDDVTTPENILWDSSNPAHTSVIANFEPQFRHSNGDIACDVYEDLKDNNKRYYSIDGGKTYFDDITNHTGSTIDSSDPNYANLKANLEKVDVSAYLRLQYDNYIDPRYKKAYYSSDGGKTFVSDPDNPRDTTLDPANPSEAGIIAALVPDCQYVTVSSTQTSYRAPNGDLFYSADGIIFKKYNSTIVLDRNNTADLLIIDTLQMEQQRVGTTTKEELPEVYYVYEDKRSGTLYYTSDGGKTFTIDPSHPSDKSAYLDPTDPADQDVLNNLEALTAKIPVASQRGAGGALTISTQEAAQGALAAIDRAIVSKDAIRAHLGALQNRLENTVTSLTIHAENLRNAESRISDVDVAQEMTQFVRNQVLTQSATAMLSQANSFPHLLYSLIG